jgi:hypothetical protein
VFKRDCGLTQKSGSGYHGFNVSYVDLNSFLSSTDLPVFGTFMEGVNIYKTLPRNCRGHE